MTPLSSPLSSSHVTYPRQTNSLLTNFLRICRNQPISDYLFIQTPDQLSPLTTPVLPEASYLCDVSVIRDTPPVLHPNPNSPAAKPNDSHRFDTRFLVVPAHTEGYITVGVGAAQCLQFVSPATHRSVAASMMFTSRFVFDASTHTFLSVGDIPEQDIFVIYYVHHRSPTTCTAISAFIRRSTFLEILTKNSTSLTLQHIVPTFCLIVSDSLQRFCPICNAPPSHQCACAFPSFPPHLFRDAVHQIHGNFVGMGLHLRLPFATSSNSSTQQIALGVAHKYNDLIPMYFMHNLRCWAISKASIADPRESVHFSRYGDVLNDARDARLRHAATIAFSKAHHAHMRKSDISTTLAELVATLAAPATKGGDVVEASVVLCAEDEHGGEVETVEWLREDWEQRECEPPPLASMCLPRQVWGNDRQCRLVRNETGLLEKHGVGLMIGERVAVRAEMHNDRLGEEGSEVVRGVPVQEGVPAETEETEETEDVATIIKKMKAEERKIRNRQSAHRSNQRKRAARAELEKEIWRERQKICELRRRENILQAENSLLRARLED